MVNRLLNHEEYKIFKWEAHTCLPLHRNASLEPLQRYHQAQVSYVSINIGMDLNPPQSNYRNYSPFFGNS